MTEGYFPTAAGKRVCPSQEQLANSILFANGPGPESRSGLLSYFLLALGLIGPSLSELNSPSKTSAWFSLPPVNQNSSHLVDGLIGVINITIILVLLLLKRHPDCAQILG